MCKYSKTVGRCVVGVIDGFKVGLRIQQESALRHFLFAIVMDRLTDEVRKEFPWTVMFGDDVDL